MEIVIEVLTKAFDTNISYAILMDIVIGFLYLFNIILGTFIGTKEGNFDVKKFFFGVLKAVCILLIIIGVCYILNVFTLTLNKIDFITLDENFVGVMELFAILITNGVDASKEVLEKIKTFRELRYVSADSVVINDNEIVEPVEYKG